MPRLRKHFGSLRSRLILLAVICAVSCVGLSALLTWRAYVHERDAMGRDLQNTSRAMAALVDAELESLADSARFLSSSPSLQRKDWAALHHDASRVAAGLDRWIVVFDLETGQQLVNTRVPWGTPLPANPPIEEAKRALRAGQTYVGDLVVGPVSGSPVIYVTAPVMRESGRDVSYGVAAVCTPQRFISNFDLSEIAPEYILTVIDRTGTIVARSRGIERFLGTKATPDIVAAVKRRDSALVHSVTLENIPVLAGITPARLGWSIAVGGPLDLLAASAQRLFWVSVVATLIIIVVTGLIAWWILRSVVRDLNELVNDTRDLGHGVISPPRQWTLKEVAFVAEVTRGTAMRLDDELVRRARTEEALRHAEQRFRLATESSGLILFEQDADLRYRWLHPLERDALGKTDEELIGAADAAPITELKLAVLRDGEIRRMECSVTYAGRRRHYALTVVAVRDAMNRIVGITGVSLDLTDRKNAEEALAIAQRDLLRANADLETKVRERTASLADLVKQMEEFTYTVSHDLRAPIRAITGFSAILLEEHASRLDPDGAELILRIARSGARMDRLINDLLMFSRVTRGEVVLAPVDLHDAVQDVLRDNPALQAVPNTITVETPLPPVIAHPTTLAQSLANLLGNGVKFVPPDRSPRVRVRAETREDGRVRIWICDNGIGIKPELHDRLFRVFERVHGSSYEGNGMGLAIVRRAVERMGGAVGVESDGVSGSRFWIELHAAQQ